MNESESIYTQDPRFEQALYRFELEENQPAQSFAQVVVSFKKRLQVFHLRFLHT